MHLLTVKIGIMLQFIALLLLEVPKIVPRIADRAQWQFLAI